MTRAWRRIGWLVAVLLTVALVGQVTGATTWRLPVKGDPGTGHLVYGRDANNLTSLTGGTAGHVLISGGANTAPSWSAITSGVTGTLPPANGGTGVASYAVGDLLYASGATTLSKLADVATGQVLVSGGVATAPSYSASPSLTAISGAGTGILQGFARFVVSAASGTTALTAAQSGGVAVNTGTSSTTTFTLPAAAAGLNYCFVEAGDAAGELLVGVTGTNTVVGKTHGAENGTGIATASSTGIKNTAATNVKGDFACLVALDTSTWLMTSVAGVWASR